MINQQRAKALLTDLLPRLNQLPFMPQACSRLISLLNEPEYVLDTIVETIDQDPVLVAHVLRVSNSSLFSPSEPIVATRIAAQMIGMERLRALASTVWVHRVFQANHHFCLGFDLQAEWQHAKQVVAEVERMAQQANVSPTLADAATSAAMLHDIGKILLAFNKPAVYIAALEEADNKPLWEAENQLIGFNHADVGSAMLEQWGLASDIVIAVRYHHQIEQQPLTQLNPAILVHLADCQVRKCDPSLQARGRYLSSLLKTKNGI